MTAPPGTRSLRAEDVEANLAEAFRAAVPLHKAEMKDWTPERRRRVGLPHGWAANIHLADSMLFKSKVSGRGARAFNMWARGLAVLAYELGGVTLFGAHWCSTDHDGCPHDWTAREPVDIQATTAEFHRILDEYEALLDTDGALPAAA